MSYGFSCTKVRRYKNRCYREGIFSLSGEIISAAIFFAFFYKFSELIIRIRVFLKASKKVNYKSCPVSQDLKGCRANSPFCKSYI